MILWLRSATSLASAINISMNSSSEDKCGRILFVASTLSKPSMPTFSRQKEICHAAGAYLVEQNILTEFFHVYLNLTSIAVILSCPPFSLAPLISFSQLSSSNPPHPLVESSLRPLLKGGRELFIISSISASSNMPERPSLHSKKISLLIMLSTLQSQVISALIPMALVITCFNE